MRLKNTFVKSLPHLIGDKKLTHCGLALYGNINIVNIDSVNGLVPDGTKPSPEPMLTPQLGRFCGIQLRAISQEVPKLVLHMYNNEFENHIFKIIATSPRDQQVNSWHLLHTGSVPPWGWIPAPYIRSTPSNNMKTFIQITFSEQFNTQTFRVTSHFATFIIMCQALHCDKYTALMDCQSLGLLLVQVPVAKTFWHMIWAVVMVL